jgi:hypothetical protein
MPSKLTRAEFNAALSNKQIDVNKAKNTGALAGLDVNKADLNYDGKVSGLAETDALFKEVDRFDKNGDTQSLGLMTPAGTPTASGIVVKSIYTILEAAPMAPLPLKDAALAKAFVPGTVLPLTRGAGPSDATIAMQYGLARLGVLNSLVDGKFGAKTEAAIKVFQQQSALPVTGAFDVATLSALDSKVANLDLRSPAAKAPNAMAYLSDFNALKMAKISISDRSKPVNWNHPEIQKAYGTFVAAYWNVCKENRIEGDCKTLSLFMMDQFRKKVATDVSVQLPLPGSERGQISQTNWQTATANSTLGYFSRFENLSTVRPGYEAAQALQKLDKNLSLLQGVNLRVAGIDANIASRGVNVTIPWSDSADNLGDESKPEIPVGKLNPGDVMFIDHTGDGKVDHMYNVISVGRDAAGLVNKIVLATGSYDDMKDADGSTSPNGLGEINNYTEEVTVDIDANGRIAKSAVTWSSEPSWLSDSRYSAHNLLMERKAGGRVSVGRWGQPS